MTVGFPGKIPFKGYLVSIHPSNPVHTRIAPQCYIRLRHLIFFCRDPDAILNPSSDYELEYGLYDYNLDRPMDPYQSLPSPTYQTEFEGGVEGDFDAGGFFSDYFEGPQPDFQGHQ